MSAWGARRQLTFFFFILFTLAVEAGAALWWFWPRPSCHDGRVNQDERGVDCGGVCPSVCPFEVKPVKVFWSRVLPLGVGAYDLAALGENPNSDFALVDVSYSLRYVDQNNLFINRVKGVLSLAPRERRALFVSNIDVGRRVPARAFLDFTTTPVWQRLTDKPELATSGPNFVNAPTPLLRANLKNSSLTDYRNLEVTTVLSDERRNAFAASATIVESLPVGETREISFSWPRPFPVEPTFIDLYPHAAFRRDVN